MIGLIHGRNTALTSNVMFMSRVAVAEMSVLFVVSCGSGDKFTLETFSMIQVGLSLLVMFVWRIEELVFCVSAFFPSPLSVHTTTTTRCT